MSCRCSSDSDEEPVSKQPRLSRRQSRESRCSSGRSTRSSFHRRNPGSREDVSDSDALSDNKLTDDGSYFEVKITRFVYIYFFLPFFFSFLSERIKSGMFNQQNLYPSRVYEYVLHSRKRILIYTASIVSRRCSHLRRRASKSCRLW